MRLRILAIFIGCVFLTSTVRAEGEPAPLPDVEWTAGPGTVPIGDMAQITIPEWYQYTGPAGAQALLQRMQNPVDGTELGILAPANWPEGESWFVLFEFSEEGYVSDKDKDSLDANAIFENMKAGNDAANKQRRAQGWTEMTLDGWAIPPRYNDTTKNLEWALKGQSDGQMIINHSTRILGRHGVMKIALVCDPGELDALLPRVQDLLSRFEYLPGKTYAEFQPGDRTAEYGLAGLVAGGALAVAAKTGILQKFWKLIVVGFVALAGVVKKALGIGNGDRKA